MRIVLLHSFYTFMDQSIKVTMSFKNRKYNLEANAHVIIIYGSCKVMYLVAKHVNESVHCRENDPRTPTEAHATVSINVFNNDP